MSMQSVTMQTPVAPATTVVSAPREFPTPGPQPDIVRSADTGSSRPVQPSSPAEKKQQLETAVKAVKDFIQPRAGNLEFSMDDETGDTIIKIVDTSSGELIRQIPSEEMLEIARALDRLQGLLISQKA